MTLVLILLLVLNPGVPYHKEHHKMLGIHRPGKEDNQTVRSDSASDLVPALEHLVSQSFVVGRGCEDRAYQSLGVGSLVAALIDYSVLDQKLDVVWAVSLPLALIVPLSADDELCLLDLELVSLNQETSLT
ncbi:hypothetical protein TorRG33x02_140000 [Trema orientale]|uniref:Uncharacterized protein n=1 Tax=Trema orientale TaxID=63057 RepID=A0A2P5EX88_TREOI|nr:hypothetical protein TorRG33x02_140000 [Trema orientale]